MQKNSYNYWMQYFIASLVKNYLRDHKIGFAQPIVVDVPKQKAFGDFSVSVALSLAKILGKPPRVVAEEIKNYIENPGGRAASPFEKIEIAGPGFINFTLSIHKLQENILEILKKKEKYGHSNIGKGAKVLLEFVSANPTGPLHVGHGRWAVIGDDIARLLAAIGYRVTREFYINDAGRQIEMLHDSINAVLEGRDVPADGYRGSYINEIADLLRPQKDPAKLKENAIRHILKKQKQALLNLNVKFDNWFSEKSLHANKLLQKTANALDKKGVTYTADGALWFRSTDFGDDKDRVLIKESGEPTYFLADIAYHLNKFQRGFHHLIDIWGTDHHGYVKRVKSAVSALGYSEDSLEIIIGQLVALYRAGELVRMSKRTGEMITLQEVIDEIGVDATRYYFAMNDAHTHLEFDLEKAKEKSMDNPVYYLQYAFARLSSIMREAHKGGHKIASSKDIFLLSSNDDRDLMKMLLDYPDALSEAAQARQPHRLINFAVELATFFHSYYHRNRVISADPKLTSARLVLVSSVKIVLKSIFDLLGISAPEKM
ncbi:MAG: arginine--tRNA ligase [Candidatus Margulisiibacteriota bacterium]